MGSFRFDNRSLSEFKRDIKNGHAREMEIIVRIAIKQKAETGEWPIIIPNGVDSFGEFIEDDKKITNRQDFLLNNKPIEITHSNKLCLKWFHEKIGKVQKCIKEKTEMVFVNGILQFKQPKYLKLSSEELEEFTIRSKAKYGVVRGPGWNKDVFRYDIEWMKDIWQILPKIHNDIPKEYISLLNKCK